MSAGDLRRRPSTRLHLGLGLVLVAAVLVVYGNALEGPFVFDDEPAVVANPSLHSLATAWQPPDDSPMTGRPLVNWSFAVNHRLGGLDPGGYHRVNLAFHGASVWLLFAALSRLLRHRPRRWLTGWADPRTPSFAAFAVTLVWALHPVLTEAVSYVTQRTELAFSFFLLLMLYAFLRSLEAEERGGPSVVAGKGWLVVAVVAAWAGAASKEVMAVAPLLVPALDALWISGSWRRAWKARWRSYLALATCWLPLGWLAATSTRSASAGFGLETLGALDYLRTQAGVILHYLRLLVWPRPLVLDYDDWPVAASWGAALPELVVVATLVALTVWGALRCRPVALAGVWFFLLLAPTSSVLPIATEIAAERRLYLASAAAVGLVVLGTAWLLGRLRIPAARRVLAGAGLAAVVLLAVAGTRERNRQWQDKVELLAHTVAHRPDNARARNNLAAALIAEGRGEEAEPHLRRALELAPDEAAHTNLGILLAGRGQWARAEGHYRRALEIVPESPQTLTNLGRALAAQDRLEEAEAAYRRSLGLQPTRAETHNNLGSLLWRRGRSAESVAAFRRAVELNPDYGEARFNLGVALAETGELGAAESELAAAARALPEDGEAPLRRAAVLARLGRRAEALDALDLAAARDPRIAARRDEYRSALEGSAP